MSTTTSSVHTASAPPIATGGTGGPEFVRAAFVNSKRNRELWSRGIAWWTTLTNQGKGPYSHSEIWLGGPVTAAWCFSSVEGTGTRFAVRNLITDGFDYVPISSDRKLARRTWQACYQLLGKKYDWIGLLGFVIHFSEHDDRDRFCSESNFEVYDQVGILNSPDARYKVSPNELAQMISSTYGDLRPCGT